MNIIYIDAHYLFVLKKIEFVLSLKVLYLISDLHNTINVNFLSYYHISIAERTLYRKSEVQTVY